MSQEKLKLPLNDQNPSPFIQPFLVLGFREGDHSGRLTWHIDIGGEITKYLQVDECSVRIRPGSGMLADGIVWMTPLLQQLIADLAQNSLTVETVGSYNGSAGPSHILRHGALFERVS